MAMFKLELPDDVIKDIEKIEGNTEKIFGEMTKAGAEVVLSDVKVNVPASFHGSNIMGCLKMTKVYKTPSDDGINTKVGFYGYFENKNGETVAAPLVCNVFEYGRSNSPFPKQPFMRNSFNASKIESAMKQAQESASGGLLTDE